MARYLLPVIILLASGCATGPSGPPNGRAASACPEDHTLACQVSPDGGRVIGSSCTCVRSRDLNGLLRGFGSGQPGAFRTRRQ